MKSVLELAKEHQIQRAKGRHRPQKGQGRTKPGYKLVNCITCGKQIDAPDFEHTPWYCYKCNEEMEAALR